MNKTILLLLLAFIGLSTANAQVGIGTITPDASAALDLTANDKGFLPPRLTTAQRDAISSPAEGLTIYNIDEKCLQWYDTNGWFDACSGPTYPLITSIDCANATDNGTLTAGEVASGVSSDISYTGGNGGPYAEQVIASTGVTGLTATLAAGTFANGSGSLTYTIEGTPDSDGTALFAINIGGQTCTLERTVVLPVGTITSIDCVNATDNGTLTSGEVASGVSSAISYTGGNGGTHSGQTVASTGITGLTATLAAGTFASGSGTLTYTISGTPDSDGIASFAINIGGQTCTLERTVELPISAFSCDSATFSPPIYEIGVSYTGTLTIPYTGGNGSSYPEYVITSTGNTDFTATLPAGNLQSGNGNLVFNVTGTSSNLTPANFAISFGGQSCNATLSACGANVNGTFKAFMCENLGVTGTQDRFSYQGGDNNGDLYQWGRNTDGHEKRNSLTDVGPIASPWISTRFITRTSGDFDWRTPQSSTIWADATKGPNDPCPSGFKVPTQAQWGGMFRDGTTSGASGTATRNTWTWTGNGYAISPLGGSTPVTLYLPAAGFRNVNGASLFNVGGNGFYWSSTVNGTNAYYLYFNSSGTVYPGTNDVRGFGYSVRCISE